MDWAGSRQETIAGILAIDSEFYGVATNFRVRVRKLLSFCDKELFADEIDARHFFGDRVLDLQSCVYFEERNGSILRDQKLTGASTDVVDLFQDGF